MLNHCGPAPNASHCLMDHRGGCVIEFNIFICYSQCKIHLNVSDSEGSNELINFTMMCAVFSISIFIFLCPTTCFGAVKIRQLF